MPIQLIDPKTGQIYSAADEAAAQAQITAYGLEPATAEQVAHYDALKEQRAQPVAGRARAAGTAALATGARLVEGTRQGIESVTGFGAEPGLVSEQGSQATAEAIAPSAFTPEAKAAREVYPGSAMAGAVAPEVVAGIAAAPLAAGAGAAGVAGTLALEFGLGASLGEAGSAALEDREMNAKGALFNGVLGTGFAALGLGLGAAYRTVTGRAAGALAETTERTVQRRVPGALARGGEDLADPAVAAQASGVVSQRTESTLGRIDKAVSSARAPVANNPTAQREALRGLAESLRGAQPEIAQRLNGLAARPRQQRFHGLLDLEATSPALNAALDELRGNAALWGDKAVAHGQAVAAARRARAGGPGAYLNALRGVDDEAVQRLAGDLSQHLDDAGGIQAAQAFAEREGRSAGAAAEDFADTDFDIAIKEIDDGKLKPEVVKLVADVAPGKRALMAHDAADSLDAIDEILKRDVSFGVKVADFERGAAELSEQQIEAQRAWLSEQAAQGRQIADNLVEARTKVETGQGYDAKGLGAEAINTLRTGLSRVEAAETAGARNVETDLFKRKVDRLVKRVGTSRSLDEGTQRWLMQQLRPYADALRDGLQNPEYWGRNAELQRALNAGWHELIEPYTRVQKKLSELLGREYGEIGAAAINRRANVDAIERVMATKQGRALYQDMAKALDGLDALARARSEHGLSQLERIDEMRAAIQNVKDQFNTASVLRIAEKRAGVPPKLSTGELATSVALDAAGMVPGLGTLTRAAKLAGRVIRGAEPEIELGAALKGTATGRLFARNLSRYARTQSELLGDTGFTRELLSPQLRRSLRRYGAPGMGGASGGGGVAPALVRVPPQLRQRVGAASVRTPQQAREVLLGSQGREHLGVGGSPSVGVDDAITATAPVSGKVGLGAVRPDQPLQSIGTQNVAVPGAEGAAGRLSASAQGAVGSVAEPTIDVFTPHVGTLAEGGIFYERLGTQKGKTPGGFFRGADGAVRYIKADKDPAHTFIESGNSKMYAALGRPAVGWDVVSLPSGEKALASVRLEGFRPLADVPDWSALPKSVRDSYAEGVPVDFIMGNWDVARNSGNVLTDGRTTVMMDAGEATSNAWGAGWFQRVERQGGDAHARFARKELGRTLMYGKGAGAVESPVGRPTHELLRPYASSEGEMRQVMGQSFDRALGAIDKAGGPEAFIRHHQPALGEAELKRAAAEMTDRIRRFKAALPFFAGALALAFTDEASAAQTLAQADSLALLERDAAQDLDETARALTDPAYAARWARQSRDLPGTLESFQGVHSTLGQAFADRRRAILRALQDPSGLSDQLAETFGSLPSSVGLKAFEVAQYLAKELPPLRGVSVTRPDGLPPHPLEQRKWALQYQTALDPSSALDDAKRGRLRHEQVKVLKDLWHDRYDELRTATLLAMGEGRSSVVQRQRADSLFGFGSALDPAFSPRLSRAAAAAHAEQGQGPGKPGQLTRTRVPAATNPGGLNALQLGASAPLAQ